MRHVVSTPKKYTPPRRDLFFIFRGPFITKPFAIINLPFLCFTILFSVRKRIFRKPVSSGPTVYAVHVVTPTQWNETTKCMSRTRVWNGV